MDKKDYELISRLDDFIDSALYKNSICVTHFLNPYEQSLAVQKLNTAAGIKYEITGGYEGSERNIVIIYPDDEYTQPQNYLAVVKIEFSKFDVKYIEHRKILGSILSLGITRDGIGDIILDKTHAYVIATKQMAKYVDKHLLKVGRAQVSTTYIESSSSVKLNLKQPVEISGTVSSLRIDSILALALKTSRSKASDLIKNQLVYVNWQLVTKPTLQISEGQIIAVRKRGRIVLREIGSSSRKNRTWVKLNLYGR